MSWLLVVQLLNSSLMASMLFEETTAFYFEGHDVDMCGVDSCMGWPAQLTNMECDKLLQCLSPTSVSETN